MLYISVQGAKPVIKHENGFLDSNVSVTNRRTKRWSHFFQYHRGDANNLLCLCKVGKHEAASVQWKHSWETSFTEVCLRLCLALHLQTAQMTELLDMGIAKRSLVNSYRWCSPNIQLWHTPISHNIKTPGLISCGSLSHAAKTTLNHWGTESTRPLQMSCGVWHQDTCSRVFELCKLRCAAWTDQTFLFLFWCSYFLFCSYIRW